LSSGTIRKGNYEKTLKMGLGCREASEIKWIVAPHEGRKESLEPWPGPDNFEVSSRQSLWCQFHLTAWRLEEPVKEHVFQTSWPTSVYCTYTYQSATHSLLCVSP
jgi:hypothetical protein